MKILVLLFASFFGFGLAIQETVRVNDSAKVTMNQTDAASSMLEEPVMHVLLDTVEVTAVAPVAVALH